MRCSTVITTYDRSDRVERAVRSALDTLRADEVIVVDDASTDGTVEILQRTFSEEISSGRLRIEALSSNIGVSGAKNAGYASARGDWVIFLDSDDEYLPGVGETIRRQLMAEAARPIVFFRCEDQAGRFIGRRRGESIELDLRTYLKFVSFGEALTAINKRVAGDSAPYIAELRGYEGIGCCRLIHDFGSALLSQYVARVYDVSHGDRLSSPRGLVRRMPLLAKGHWTMVREFWGPMPIGTALGYVAKSLIYRAVGQIYRFCEKTR